MLYSAPESAHGLSLTLSPFLCPWPSSRGQRSALDLPPLSSSANPAPTADSAQPHFPPSALLPAFADKAQFLHTPLFLPHRQTQPAPRAPCRVLSLTFPRIPLSQTMLSPKHLQEIAMASLITHGEVQIDGATPNPTALSPFTISSPFPSPFPPPSQTMLSPKHVQEIAMATLITHGEVQIDGATPNPTALSASSVVRKLDKAWPWDLKRTIDTQTVSWRRTHKPHMFVHAPTHTHRHSRTPAHHSETEAWPWDLKRTIDTQKVSRTHSHTLPPHTHVHAHAPTYTHSQIPTYPHTRTDINNERALLSFTCSPSFTSPEPLSPDTAPDPYPLSSDEPRDGVQ
jgi:hypothetical protein